MDEKTKNEKSIAIARKLITLNDRRLKNNREALESMEAESLNLKQRIADANSKIKRLRHEIGNLEEQIIQDTDSLDVLSEYIDNTLADTAEILVDSLALEKYMLSLYETDKVE